MTFCLQMKRFMTRIALAAGVYSRRLATRIAHAQLNEIVQSVHYFCSNKVKNLAPVPQIRGVVLAAAGLAAG